MRVIFISYFGVYERYILKQISHHFELCRIIRLLHEAPSPRKADWKSKLRRPWHKAKAYITLPIRNKRDKIYDREGRKRLSDCALSDIGSGLIEVPDRSINDPDCVELIKGLEPDVIVVCRAPVLKPGIYSAPRLACLNIHYGIAPLYRGEHTQFWPLLLEDYEHIGVTIHHINRGIDTGTVLARGYPSLDPEDDEFSLRAKSAELAGKLIIEVLQNIEDRAGPRPPSAAPPQLGAQQPVGRLYLLLDRGLIADMRYHLKRNILGKRPPARAERIERFY